jgi:hypothetical protein
MRGLFGQKEGRLRLAIKERYKKCYKEVYTQKKGQVNKSKN